MGKAGVGLPDPLDHAASPTGAAGTDDLLAQLAGEEIDRMLADADRDAGAAPATDDPAAPQTAPGGDAQPLPPAGATDPLKLLDEVQKRADAIEEGVKNLTPAPAGSPSPTAAEQAMLDELHQLFQEVSPPAPPAPGEAPAGEAPAEPWQPRAKVTTTAQDATTDAAIDAELNALFVEATARDSQVKPPQATGATEAPAAGDPLAGLEAELASATTDPAGVPSHPEATDGLPVYLKPLEWLNAPFAGLSQGLREALGKIAIVTLVNAFAVLLYVMIFRGR